MRASRRSTAPLNPFVVFSDVTLTVILILLFYFTSLFYVARRQQEQETSHVKAQLVAQGNTILSQKGQIEDMGAEIFKLTHSQAERTQTVAAMQQAVEQDVITGSALRAFTEHIVISHEGDTQVFSFQANGLFKQQEAALDPHSIRYLQTFAETLAAALRKQAWDHGYYPEIQIQGHTDKAPYDNWTLSMERALAVIKVFSNSQLHREYLSAAGYSCHRPRVDPNSAADQSPNRRIEVRLVYNTRPFRVRGFRPELPNDCKCDL